MKFNVNTFHPICIFQLRYNKLNNNRTSHSLQTLLKITVINEGSHTRLIQYLTNQDTKIKLLQQNEKKLTIIERRIRYVWLETSTYTKITFARSLWKIKKKDFNNNKIQRNLPIGQSFIQSKIDINKEINELYYCYCKELRSQEAIWGRKYKLNYEDNSSILIQEFFSKKIALFSIKTHINK
uniref:hypothetical protein n=1 Tax=Pterosiphonia complanata TaxID=884089 RepID=UPI0022FDA52D|nr:hypothetical protein PNW47_pgp148 [Pterosiphonia complanata]WAX03047.1 hypothetical protein [Pterosiphonia complanata]